MYECRTAVVTGQQILAVGFVRRIGGGET